MDESDADEDRGAHGNVMNLIVPAHHESLAAMRFNVTKREENEMRRSCVLAFRCEIFDEVSSQVPLTSCRRKWGNSS